MRRGRLLRRRDAHQPFDREAVVVLAGCQESVGFLWQDARFLRLGAGIDLDEKAGTAALARHLLSERARNFRPVDRFDHIEERDRFRGLVRLQGPDEAQLDAGVVRPDRRPFRCRFLHPVLAEDGEARCNRAAHPVFTLHFRGGDDDGRLRAPSLGERAGEALIDRSKIGGDIVGGMSDVCHEGLRTRASKLAAAARALKEAASARAPFSLAFMTDRRRIPDPEPVIRALPAGSAIIHRDYEDPRRENVARRVLAIARGRGVLFLVGGDARLAAAIGADGVHLPSFARMSTPERTRGLIVSAACHNAADLDRAAAQGADVALLSPVFPTESHPGAEHLGPSRLKTLAARSRVPVLALGGVDETNAALLKGANVAGIAAIGAFLTAPPASRS